MLEKLKRKARKIFKSTAKKVVNFTLSEENTEGVTKDEHNVVETEEKVNYKPLYVFVGIVLGVLILRHRWIGKGIKIGAKMCNDHYNDILTKAITEPVRIRNNKTGLRYILNIVEEAKSNIICS